MTIFTYTLYDKVLFGMHDIQSANTGIRNSGIILSILQPSSNPPFLYIPFTITPGAASGSYCGTLNFWLGLDD
jgi:hypothetical protein